MKLLAKISLVILRFSALLAIFTGIVRSRVGNGPTRAYVLICAAIISAIVYCLYALGAMAYAAWKSNRVRLTKHAGLDRWGKTTEMRYDDAITSTIAILVEAAKNHEHLDYDCFSLEPNRFGFQLWRGGDMKSLQINIRGERDAISQIRTAILARLEQPDMAGVRPDKGLMPA